MIICYKDTQQQEKLPVIPTMRWELINNLEKVKANKKKFRATMHSIVLFEL